MMLVVTCLQRNSIHLKKVCWTLKIYVETNYSYRFPPTSCTSLRLQKLHLVGLKKNWNFDLKICTSLKTLNTFQPVHNILQDSLVKLKGLITWCQSTYFVFAMSLLFKIFMSVLLIWVESNVALKCTL